MQDCKLQFIAKMIYQLKILKTCCTIRYCIRFTVRNKQRTVSVYSKPNPDSVDPDLRQNRTKLVVQMISNVFLIVRLWGFFNLDLRQYRIKSAYFTSRNPDFLVK